MAEVVLRFPLLNGGRAGGINGADLETFAKDPSYYVARECAQNTLDATVGNHTAELHFTYQEIPVEKLPCLLDLKDVFERCKEYRPQDDDLRLFCENGIRVLSQKKIPVLIVSDYMTTGLTGSDVDVDGRWYGLVKSEGSSNKDPDAGGSFGIGKAAPLAASSLRTVYYSTKTENGCAFQGVSAQTTHKNKDGKKTQSVGYIGYYNNSPGEDENYFPAIRDINEIPDFLVREKIGTSIYIPGYCDTENWENNILKSLLNDFWLAILHAKISFKVGNTLLDKTNVGKLINDYKGADGFTADRYYRAYLSGKCFSGKLNHIDDVKLYLMEEVDLPDKRVSYMRRNYMLIYEESNFRFRKNFTGLFICDNEKGNKILRAMEPPKHDEWQPKREKLLSRYPDIDGKNVLDSIRKLINAKVKELMPLSITPQFELDDIKKYLPFSDDGTEETEKGKVKEEEKETFKKIVTDTDKITIPVVRSDDLRKDDDGEEQAPVNGGENATPKPGPVPPIPPGPVPPTPAPPSPGPGHRFSPAVKAKIKSRLLLYSNKENYYLVALTSQNADFDGNLHLHSVGDDGEVDKIKVCGASNNGNTITINPNGTVRLQLTKDKTERIKLFVENNEELSLRFTYGS